MPLFLENPKISNVIPVCLPWKPEDPGNQFHDDDKMVVTGWGRITNNRDFNRNNLLRFNVSTRTLQKLSLPIANNNCSTQYIVGKKFNFEKHRGRFEAFGKTHGFTNSGKGFAFLTFSSEEAATTCIETLNNTEIDGQTVMMNIARGHQGKGVSISNKQIPETI